MTDRMQDPHKAIFPDASMLMRTAARPMRSPSAASAFPCLARGKPDRKLQIKRDTIMGINTEKDITANLQIGPTDVGMVRIFVEADSVEIPMDFDPEEAEEIADEIRAAAMAARAATKKRR